MEEEIKNEAGVDTTAPTPEIPEGEANVTPELPSSDGEQAAPAADVAAEATGEASIETKVETPSTPSAGNSDSQPDPAPEQGWAGGHSINNKSDV